eukprot:54739-Chlamydomonas_euryale.AAC.1
MPPLPCLHPAFPPPPPPLPSFPFHSPFPPSRPCDPAHGAPYLWWAGTTPAPPSRRRAGRSASPARPPR